MQASSIVLAGIVGASLAVAASAQETADDPVATDLFGRDTYRIDTLVCPFKERIDYEPGEIECGLLEVPENREDPNSRFIDLHFIKLSSTWDDEEEDDDEDDDDSGLEPGRRDDPVIYLTGGPGAPAEYYVNRFKDHGIRKHRDLYILEQRGIETSDNLCDHYATRNRALSNVESLAASNEAARLVSAACVKTAMASGVDVSAYNTVENARDVKALRIALGFDQWNVWGISYGTLLGQAYIKEDPEGILAVVLDAIVPLDARAHEISWRVINWYDRDLEKLNELCQADSGCAGSFPDLGQRVREGAQSVIDEPIVVDVEDTEIYPSGKAYILSDIAAFLPFALFYEQSNYPVLPAVIHAWADALEERDETFFKALAIGIGGGALGGGGMYDAIMCMDGYREAAIVSTALDREEHPVLSSATEVKGDAEAWAQGCVDLGLAPRPREDFAAVETDIPTLLVEGDMDPITPPPLAHLIEPGFSNGTYVEFPYAGHGPSRSVECAGDFLNKFFDNPTADPDLSCVDEMEVPDFIGSIYTTSFGPRMAVLAMENKDDLPKVAAWGGFGVIGVVIGFIVLTFAPLVRLVEKRKPAPADGARLATWGAAFSGTLALVIFGAAAGVSYKISEFLLLFGMVGWGGLGAWLGVLAGLLGLGALGLSVRARFKSALPVGSLIGFVFTGLAAVLLSAFLLSWGLGPGG